MPVTLDVVALEQKPGPSEYGDALVTAVLLNPVRESLRRVGVTRRRRVIADEVRHLHDLRWECLQRGVHSPFSRLLYPDFTARTRRDLLGTSRPWSRSSPPWAERKP